jgi:hypothetical protein
MKAPKSAETASPKPAPASEAARKPWKKKTPVEVVLDQIERVKEDVGKREEELKQARRQLQKLEDVKKVLEST